MMCSRLKAAAANTRSRPLPVCAAIAPVSDIKGPPVVKGDIEQVTCDRLALGGKGVCFKPDSAYVILCERALPGEVLTAKIGEVNKGYAEAVKVESLEPHNNAVQPPCQHFGACGGCTLQSMAYEAQLSEKQNQVIQTMTRVGKLDLSQVTILPILGVDSPNPWTFRATNKSSHQVDSNTGSLTGGRDTPSSSSTTYTTPSRRFRYRNKVLFTFSSRRWQVEDNSTPQGSTIENIPTLGFLKPGTADQVLHIQDCHLAPSTTSTILQAVREHADRLSLMPSNDPSGKGCIVSVVVRHAAEAWHEKQGGSNAAHDNDEVSTEAAHTSTSNNSVDIATVSCKDVHELQGSGDTSNDEATPGVFMVVINTTEGAPVDKLEDLAQAVIRDVPQVVGVVQRIVTVGNAAGKSRQSAAAASPKQRRSSSKPGNNNTKQGKTGGSALSDDETYGNAKRRVLAGVAHLVENMCGLRFRVSPESFFQTNTKQAEVLYGAVAAAAQLGQEDTLLDLYCGTGSIGLSLASQCNHVLGYEAIESAVVDARFNAQLNGITNASFICGDLEDGLIQPKSSSSTHASAHATVSNGSDAAVSTWSRPNVVVVNPARAGLSKAVIRYLLACGARRVIYVSCNPATQARDLSLLCNPTLDLLSTRISTSKLKASPSNRTGKGSAQTGKTTKPAKGGAHADHGNATISPALPGGIGSSGDARFRLVSVQPVDMFPHTDHVENVVVLDRVAS